MIALIIFYSHIVAFTFGFAKQYQKEGIGLALASLGLFIIIFSVGWSVVTMILKFLILAEGFGFYFNRDAISLLILTICEIIFYNFYYKK
ncbi:MAG: hypothetical protein AAB255_03725 [Bacteroidota bacterium]